MVKTVLVTGATGFVGRHCVAPLLARGFEVHTASRSHTAALDGAIHHPVDLLDSVGAAALLARIQPTHLLHLAWYAEPALYWSADANVDWLVASLALARAFHAHGGQRMVVAGSCAEYAWRDEPCDERSTVLVPSTLYGACKHALHLALEAWAQPHAVSLAWGRLFFLYGPHERPERLVPSVVRGGIARTAIECTTGTQRRDFLHVEDAGGALVALLDSPVTGPVNIASGHATEVGHVIRTLATLLDADALVRWGAVPRSARDPEVLEAVTSRLAREVGWRDHYTLATGLAATVAWWRALRDAA